MIFVKIVIYKLRDCPILHRISVLYFSFIYNQGLKWQYKKVENPDQREI